MIDWYSKGAIFKRPTVLGGMGVGDAHNGIGSNAEAILPINQLPKLLGLDGENGKTVNFNIKEMKLLDKGDQASNLSQLNFLASV